MENYFITLTFIASFILIVFVAILFVLINNFKKSEESKIELINKFEKHHTDDMAILEKKILNSNQNILETLVKLTSALQEIDKRYVQYSATAIFSQTELNNLLINMNNSRKISIDNLYSAVQNLIEVFKDRKPTTAAEAWGDDDEPCFEDETDAHSTYDEGPSIADIFGYDGDTSGMSDSEIREMCGY